MIGLVYRRKAFTPTQGIHWAHPKCGQVRQALLLLPEPEHTAADRRAAWPLASGWSAGLSLLGGGGVRMWAGLIGHQATGVDQVSSGGLLPAPHLHLPSVPGSALSSRHTLGLTC